MKEDAQLKAWMKAALEQAELAAQEDEVPIGAVIVSAGEIIARGRNKREKSHRTCAHAELVALDEYNQKYKSWRLPLDAVLVVTTEPCVMCTGALLWARVGHVVYGCKDPKNAGLHSISSLIDEGRYDHRFAKVTGGILEEDCAAIIQTFFQKKRDATKA